MKKLPEKSRYTLIILSTIFLGLMMSILLFTGVQQARIITVLSDNLNATREQVQDAGAIPISPPADKLTQVPAITDLKGPKGDTGPEGRPLTRGEVLSIFSIYCTENACVGSPGAPGAVGAVSIIPGPPGQDSTVEGPPGADSTVAGPTGPTGLSGTNGEPPFSWVVSRTLVDGTIETESCIREEPFVKEVPKYTCTIDKPIVK